MVTREIEFKAPIQTAFDVIRDFESYTEFVKGTKSVQERQTERGIEVDFEIDVVKRVSYTLLMTVEEPTRIHWHLLEGELFKENRGGWTLQKIDENTTKAIYEIEVSFGWMVPKGLVQGMTETQLPELLKSFKERIEARVSS